MTEPTPPKNLDEIPYIIMPGAFGKHPQTVPVVVYDKAGARYVVGESVVYEDGTVEGIIQSEQDVEFPMGIVGLGPFSIGMDGSLTIDDPALELTIVATDSETPLLWQPNIKGLPKRNKKKEALKVRKAALAERKSTALSLEDYLDAKRAHQATMRAEAETAVMRIPQWMKEHPMAPKKTQDPILKILTLFGGSLVLIAIGAFLILQVLLHK